MTRATMPIVSDEIGNRIPARPIVPVDLDGAYAGIAVPETYQLASSLTLASAGTTTPQNNIIGGSYIWAYQLSGTSPALVLESLGPDGVTFMVVATVYATGAQGVVIGGNGTVRLRNSGANAITGLSSSLS